MNEIELEWLVVTHLNFILLEIFYLVRLEILYLVRLEILYLSLFRFLNFCLLSIENCIKALFTKQWSPSSILLS